MAVPRGRSPVVARVPGGDGEVPVAMSRATGRGEQLVAHEWGWGSHTLLQNMPLFQAICPGRLWARDNRWLLSRVQRLAGPGGGQGTFVPVGGTNRDKRVAFYPGWWLHPRSLLSRLEPPTGIKGPPFVPVGISNRDKRPLSPPIVPGPNAAGTNSLKQKPIL